MQQGQTAVPCSKAFKFMNCFLAKRWMGVALNFTIFRQAQKNLDKFNV